jgi:two-component system chemotaxis response regulator CheB
MVVDDSVVVRGLIARWIDADPDLETVAKCTNGKAALDALGAARPDIIVLDIEMPVMDGLTALPRLLDTHPHPHVIIVSSRTRRNAALAVRALSLGASECLSKPEREIGAIASAAFRSELISKIRGLGGLDVPFHRFRSAATFAAGRRIASSAAFDLVPFNRTVPRVLAIASSTGGPRALATVLADAGPALAKVATLITQHMPLTFTEMLAQNLAHATGFPAKEAGHGETPVPGVIYVAPGGRHLVVRRDAGNVVMSLDDRPPVNFTRPSADVMLDSIAAVYGRAALAVVLTGMGQDGAAGVMALRSAGGNVIAQNEATSVVWGMPGAAAHTGMCSAVLPLGEIGARIARVIHGGTA